MKKMCAKCGGSMKNGGPVTKIKKKVPTMAKGGTMYGIPQTGTTNYSAPTMAKGGKVTTLKKKGMGGMHMMPDGTIMKDSSMMKKGGIVRKKKLAALAPPTNKITRADVIAGALKNKRKKK